MSKVKSVSTDSDVTLISLYSGGMEVVGQVSGRKYFFPHPGSEVKVNKQDAEILLEKSRKTCCGGGIQRFFQLGGT